jgi:DNA-binding CsgD family transcriptional regulator
VLGRLDDLADAVEGELASTRAAHAQALAHGGAEALAQISEAFDNLGADLLAAEAAADAAVAWRRSGDVRRATGCERKAGVLVDRCEGAVTPALQAVDMRARLTQAERQIALLAAAGRSNKQVAEAVFLAVRTVENHLQRVYEKLGIAGRTQLVLALNEAGLTEANKDPQAEVAADISRR